MTQKKADEIMVISEFMGMKPAFSGEEIMGWFGEDGKMKILGMYDPHEDWRELHEVLEKIESLTNNLKKNGMPLETIIESRGNNHKCTIVFNQHPKFQEKSIISKKDAVIKCVIEFCKWYKVYK